MSSYKLACVVFQVVGFIGGSILLIYADLNIWIGVMLLLWGNNANNEIQKMEQQGGGRC